MMSNQEKIETTQESFANLDAAINVIIEDGDSAKNVDVVGTAVALSAIAMDRVENMLIKLKSRGKRRAWKAAPLTIDKPFARSPGVSAATERQSPVKTAVESESSALNTGIGLKNNNVRTARSQIVKTAIQTYIGQSPVKQLVTRSPLLTAKETTPLFGRTARSPSFKTGIDAGKSSTPKTGLERSPKPFESPVALSGRKLKVCPSVCNLQTAKLNLNGDDTSAQGSVASEDSSISTRTALSRTPIKSQRSQPKIGRNQVGVRTDRSVPSDASRSTKTGVPKSSSKENLSRSKTTGGKSKSNVIASILVKTSDVNTAREKSDVSSRTAISPSQNRKLTPAEQWKNVQPGPGPKIVPKQAEDLSLKTALETLSKTFSVQQQKAQKQLGVVEKIWKDLKKAADQQDLKTMSSPTLPIGSPVGASASQAYMVNKESIKTVISAKSPIITARAHTYQTVKTTRSDISDATLQTAREKSCRSPFQSTRLDDANLQTAREKSCRNLFQSQALFRTGRSPTYGTGRSPGPATAKSPIVNVNKTGGRNLSVAKSNTNSSGKSSGYLTALSPSVDKSSGFSTAFSPSVDKSSGYPTAKSPTPFTVSASASISSTDLCPVVDASQIPRRDRFFSNGIDREESPPKSPYVNRFSPRVSKSSSQNSLSTCRSPGLVTQPSSRPKSPLICRSRTNSSNFKSFPSNPSLPKIETSQDNGVDRVTVESSDEDVAVTTTTFEVDNTVVDPVTGTRRRKMKPKRIILNGEVVWKKQ